MRAPPDGLASEAGAEEDFMILRAAYKVTRSLWKVDHGTLLCGNLRRRLPNCINVMDQGALALQVFRFCPRRGRPLSRR